jgi:hypothetical protein
MHLDSLSFKNGATNLRLGARLTNTQMTFSMKGSLHGSFGTSMIGRFVGRVVRNNHPTLPVMELLLTINLLLTVSQNQ